MQIFISINKASITPEELALLLQKAAEVAPYIEDGFFVRKHVVILRDDQKQKIGEMGMMG